MRNLPPDAQTRLAEILGPPLLVPSELKGGELVTIYPRCDWATLKRFRKNWNVNEIEGQTTGPGGEM